RRVAPGQVPRGAVPEPAEGETGVEADPLHQPLPGQDVADRPEPPGRLDHGGGRHRGLLPEAAARDGEPPPLLPPGIQMRARPGARDGGRGRAGGRGGRTPPATTRVVVARPVCLDASGVTAPTAVPAPTTSGNRAGLSPHRSMIDADHVRAPRSNRPDVEPIE